MELECASIQKNLAFASSESFLFLILNSELNRRQKETVKGKLHFYLINVRCLLCAGPLSCTSTY